jgi:hypothetical protein
MSHFYGTLQGNRGEATRCGTKDSGITTVAASWSGAVRCETYIKDGVDCVMVQFVTWHGAGNNRIIYDGPIDGTEIPETITLKRRLLEA